MRKATKARRGLKRQTILKLVIVFVVILVGFVFAYLSLHKTNKTQPPQSTSYQSTGGLSVSSGSAGTISIGGETPQTATLLQYINNARSSNGLAPVAENSLLDKSAKLKADNMINSNYWSHNAPDGTQWQTFIQQAGYVYSAAAENLAYGKYEYYPEQTIVNNWLNSAEHRENMLNGRYTEIGIAIVKAASFNGQQNVWLIVTHYGTPAKQTGSGSTSYSQSTSTYSPNLSQYLPPSYSSTPMPTFNNSSATTYQAPQTPSCANPALADSSYYCGQ